MPSDQQHGRTTHDDPIITCGECDYHHDDRQMVKKHVEEEGHVPERVQQRESETERTRHTAGRWWRYGRHAKELASDMYSIMVEEWNSRTKVGKAIYPLWVLNATMMWVIALSVLSFFLLATPIVRFIRGDWPDWDLWPAIYKEEKK